MRQQRRGGAEGHHAMAGSEERRCRWRCDTGVLLIRRGARHWLERRRKGVCNAGEEERRKGASVYIARVALCWAGPVCGVGLCRCFRPATYYGEYPK
jgi:hypothetical protein